jgi:hypothetical protein
MCYAPDMKRNFKDFLILLAGLFLGLQMILVILTNLSEKEGLDLYIQNTSSPDFQMHLVVVDAEGETVYKESFQIESAEAEEGWFYPIVDKINFKPDEFTVLVDFETLPDENSALSSYPGEAFEASFPQNYFVESCSANSVRRCACLSIEANPINYFINETKSCI